MLLKYQIQVFEEFLGDYSRRLTGSFIAEKKGMNQKTTSTYLNKLEKEHILKSKTEGKNKLYFLNLDNKEIVKNFIIAIEHLRTIELFKKNILIKEISEKIQPLIRGITLIFGSYAKDTQKKDSDLDILIIGKCNEKEIDDISQIYNIQINVKIYPRLKKDILTKEAIKNHIIVKNSEQLVEAIING
ncbi:MAG: nucleotidyltransferase domain-containing protein [archaeon]